MTRIHQVLILLAAAAVTAPAQSNNTALFRRALPATGTTGITAPAISANMPNRGQILHLITIMFPTAIADVTALQVRLEASYDNALWFPISRDVTTAAHNGSYASAIERANSAYPFIRVRALAVSATYPMTVWYTGSSEPLGNVIVSAGRIIASPPGAAEFSATWGMCVGTNCATGTNLTNVWISTRTQTVQSCQGRTKTAPTGSALTIDINKNGTTSIFATPLSIAAAASTGTASSMSSAATLADGDYLTIDIDAVGSTIPGKDLTIVCTLQ